MIKKIDHIVITTKYVQKCKEFYEILGFKWEEYMGRYQLSAGDFKINVHIYGRELLPKAGKVTPGSVDICFEIDEDIKKVYGYLQSKGMRFETGIVARNGVKGQMSSLYLRDPDLNLVELCFYGR